MIIVDASLIADFLLESSDRPEIKELILAQDQLGAPDLIAYEVRSVLRKHNLRGELNDTRAEQCIEALNSLQIELFPIEVFAGRAWNLRHNISFYDAAYVALAEHVRLTLYTTDKRLAATTGHTANIVVL